MVDANVSDASNMDQDKLLFRHVNKDPSSFSRAEFEDEAISSFICGSVAVFFVLFSIIYRLVSGYECKAWAADFNFAADFD